MADIVDINSRRPHTSGEAKCLYCGHVWKAVIPDTVDFWHIPCPQCNLERGVFACNAQPSPNQLYFQCATCTRDVYYVVREPDGVCIMCASCGTKTDIGEL